jgi:hypothetical protein
MKKRMNKIGMALIGLSLIVTPVWAGDYSSMTTEELSSLRGTMKNQSQEEHAAFQQEWQSRTQNMTPEERQQYKGKSASGPQDGSGNQYGNNNKGNSANGPQDGSGNQYGNNNKGKSANGPQDGSGKQYGKNKKNKKSYNYANANNSEYSQNEGMGGGGGRGHGRGGGKR